MPKKFGFDKRKAHLSSLIVAGQITREEAIIELSKPLYSDNELNEDKEYLAKKLGITLSEFESIMNQSNKVFTDYPSDFNKDRLFKSIIRKLSMIKNKVFIKSKYE